MNDIETAILKLKDLSIWIAINNKKTIKSEIEQVINILESIKERK